MRRLSIARSLLLALLGLTLALAVVAGLAVGALYEARQDYEDELALSYRAEAATAGLLAAGVVEEAVLRGARRAGDRRDAAAAYERAAEAARRAAEPDGESVTLVDDVVATQGRARELAPALNRGSRTAAGRFADELRASRDTAGQLASRQRTRREGAREAAESDTRRATISAAVAGGLALLAALGLVGALIAGLRRPLATLVDATGRLAGGDLSARVEPEGPVELRRLGESFNEMAGDLEAAREAVEAERRRLATVIESLGDALIICDAHGEVVQVNPRARELVPELAPGHDLAKDPGPLPQLEPALAGEVRVDHHDRVLAVTAARLGPQPRHGVVFTVRDISERARLEQAKSDFVATASHELRSPLTSIKGFVELLSHSADVGDREREFIDIILLSTNRLVDLVNDLLDVARVEAGHLEIHRRPIAVDEALEEVAILMRPRVEDKDQQLEIDVPPRLPAAFADPARLRQIVTNLVTNAHLYTPEGGRITVRARADDENVAIAVADTGRGMTPVEVERIFERFYRGDGSNSAHPGTGLGLSIVKSLVDLHDGTVGVESEPGEGTTFTVRLPRAPAAADLPSPRLAIHGKRVLVVEDEAEIATLIAEQLAPYEVTPVVASSVDEAIRRLRADHFDAVTLDIFLGGGSGFDVLHAMRDDPELRTIPVVVVSVMAGEEALAGEWTVTKPIDADELTDALGSALLAGRSRVLVVGRDELRDRVGPPLERLGLDYAWATTGPEAARLCEEQHFEVALVDAGMRSPQTALEALDLRGRRLRRSVIVFSTEEDPLTVARLDPDPVPVEEATAAVVAALRGKPDSSLRPRDGERVRSGDS